MADVTHDSPQVSSHIKIALRYFPCSVSLEALIELLNSIDDTLEIIDTVNNSPIIDSYNTIIMKASNDIDLVHFSQKLQSKLLLPDQSQGLSKQVIYVDYFPYQTLIQDVNHRGSEKVECSFQNDATSNIEKLMENFAINDDKSSTPTVTTPLVQHLVHNLKNKPSVHEKSVRINSGRQRDMKSRTNWKKPLMRK
ncbi:MAG: hypothetical protein MHMPM18_001210 [Marteilia pararefringens]